jgi:teichuronic acid exporter
MRRWVTLALTAESSRAENTTGVAPESTYLDHQLVYGIAWTATLRWSAQALSWLATLFAARLLRPADYGIVSMATVALGFVRMVEDFGLDSVLVQDRSITGAQQASLAGIILAIGAGFCVGLIAAAHPIALFFKEPQVGWALAALSLLLITDALQVVPRATLQRELEFRRFAALSLVQVVATQSVLIIAAFAGMGFWSLVLSSLAGGIALTLTLCRWRPYQVAWPRHITTLARPLTQGWRVIVQRFAYYTYTSADQTIVGRVLGKDALGSYSFALTFSNLPLQEVTAIVSRVVPGVFSQVQRERSELRRYFLLLTEFMACITTPMAIGLALTADLVVQVTLGPAWHAVVTPLRVLCVYAAFQGSQILMAHVLIWTGGFRPAMWCTLFAAVILPIGFALAVGRGLVAVAVVWAVLYPITDLPVIILALRRVDVRVRSWLHALVPALTGCLVMTAAVLAVRMYVRPGPPLLALAVSATIGAAAYCASMWLGFRRRVLAMIEFSRAIRRNEARPGLVSPT